MRNIIFLYSGILFLVFLILSISTFSDEDYSIERRLWRINKQFTLLSRDPEAVPMIAFEHLEKKYFKILQKYQRSKAVEPIYIILGRVHIFQKDYPKARATFSQILKRYPDNHELCSQALFWIGKSYEIENNSQEAQNAYKQIIHDYPLSSVGISIPLYIANYYQSKNNYSQATSAYNQAVEFYKKISLEYPNSPLEYNALQFLTQCFIAKNRWADAVHTLGDILLKYPTIDYLTPEEAELIIKKINSIAMNKLKDPSIAMDIYENFTNRYPKHPLNNSLKIMLDNLNDLKEQKIGVSSSAGAPNGNIYAISF